MSEQDPQLSMAMRISMLLAIGVTVLFALWLLGQSRRLEDGLVVQFSQPRTPREAAKRPGVRAEITAGGVSVSRSLPELAFTIGPDQSLDARLSAGPFTGIFTVTFPRGSVQMARFGATMRNGGLIIRHDGQVPLSDHVGDEPRTVLTPLPVTLSRAIEEIEYEFNATGDGPWMLEAVWKPDGSDEILPLPNEDRPG